ncbi:metal-dependent phosphohydrolase, partial [Trifolium medium]|nr:metal-dependent phosphohydrolase [Trifolium medium]
AMKGNDASHDAAHVWRVRDLALSLASEEGLSSDPDSMEIVELAALLHDIGDYKYLRDPSEEKAVENFLTEEGVEENKKSKILKIINGMGKLLKLTFITCVVLTFTSSSIEIDILSSSNMGK